MEENNKKEEVKEETSSNVTKEQASKKKGAGGMILILIALVLVLFVVWFFLLGGNETLGFKKSVEEANKQEKAVEVDITSDEVTKALENFNNINITNDELTKNGEYNISSLTLKQKIEALGRIVGIKKQSAIAFCGNDFKEDLTLEDMNNYLKEVLDTTLTLEELKSNGVEEKVQIIVDDDPNPKILKGILVSGGEEYSIWIIDGKYYLRSYSCDGFSVDNVVYKKTIKAEKDDNNLYVYEKRAFYEIGNEFPTEEMPKVEIKYYKDYAKKELVETVEGTHVTALNDYYKQEKDITWDSYNTYKYTFKIKDGNYYFEKFELVK